MGPTAGGSQTATIRPFSIVTVPSAIGSVVTGNNQRAFSVRGDGAAMVLLVFVWDAKPQAAELCEAASGRSVLRHKRPVDDLLEFFFGRLLIGEAAEPE